MWPGLRCAVLAAVALSATAAGSADAATYCVATSGPDCTETATSAAGAFAAAGDGDRIVLGALEETGPLGSADRIEVVGAGARRTVLDGVLTLADPGARVAELGTSGLDLAGTATQVQVTGTVLLRGAAVLQAATVAGRVATAEAVPADPDPDVRLHSVLVRAESGAALEACPGTLVARHVTVTGTGESGARACPGAALELRDSIVAGAFDEPLAGSLVVEHTVHGAAAPVLEADGRLPAGSPLLDTATPLPLADDEWPEDRDRLPRVLDGDGDGVPERDPGAFETAMAAAPPASGNLLTDPGAEAGGVWALTAGFTRERYGAFPFPSHAAATALNGGDAFFAGGPGPAGTASQVIDVTGMAPEIDRATATTTLSGLLGGYRADGDAGSLDATFLDPAGRPLGTISLAGPTAAERANATTLVHRGRADPVPPLTRAIDVTMHATRTTGSYDDAYFDNVVLTLSAPGAPPAPPAPEPGQPGPKPFVGIRAFTALATLDAQGRVGVRLGCVDATVGQCATVVTLTAVLQRGASPVSVGMAAAVLAPGAIRRVRIRLTTKARRVVRARKRLRMTLFAAARDGQGLTRVSTVPIVVQRPQPRRRALRPR